MFQKKFSLLNPGTLFEDLFPSDPFRHRRSGSMMNHGLQTDIKETDDHYELLVNVPGLTKEDIDISLENGYLSITATQKEEKEEESSNYVRRERFYRSACRSFFVGEDITQEEIKAGLDAGVLKLSIPKVSEEKVVAKQKIEIK